MPLSAADLTRCLPAGGWPDWVFLVPYASEAVPSVGRSEAPGAGANCQRFAYDVLALFGRDVPPHRSSELWADERLTHVVPADARDLDLVLFNGDDDAWGAHVALVLGESLLHLCAEVGVPTVWSWQDFSARERYRTVVGVVRV